VKSGQTTAPALSIGWLLDTVSDKQFGKYGLRKSRNELLPDGEKLQELIWWNAAWWKKMAEHILWPNDSIEDGDVKHHIQTLCYATLWFQANHKL
jgi:hypothetical protein